MFVDNSPRAGVANQDQGAPLFRMNDLVPALGLSPQDEGSYGRIAEHVYLQVVGAHGQTGQRVQAVVLSLPGRSRVEPPWRTIPKLGEPRVVQVIAVQSRQVAFLSRVEDIAQALPDLSLGLSGVDRAGWNAGAASHERDNHQQWKCEAMAKRLHVTFYFCCLEAAQN